MTSAERDAASRHATRLERRAGRALFVKRARGAAERSELAREAWALALVRGRCPAAAEAVPRLVGWDPADGRLTLEAVDGRDLGRAVEAAGHLPVGAAARVGLLAATLHDDGARLDGEALPAALTKGVIEWHRPAPGLFRHLSIAGLQLIEAVQRSERLSRHLDRLAATQPTAETLVHGDLRWENVLVDDREQAPPRIRLVDWEFAGQGEAVWDVACFMAACLSAWIASVPQIPGVPPDRLIELAGLPLEAVTPGLVAFRLAYQQGRGGAGAAGAAWTLRCAELVAVRLVHLALEATGDAEALRTAPVLHLQVALNILDDPAGAARELLGMMP